MERHVEGRASNRLEWTPAWLALPLVLMPPPERGGSRVPRLLRVTLTGPFGGTDAGADLIV